MSPGKAQTLWALKEHENPPSTGAGNEGLEQCWFWRPHFSPTRAPTWTVKLLALTYCGFQSLFVLCVQREKEAHFWVQRRAWHGGRIRCRRDNTAGRGSSARSLHRPQTLSPYKNPTMPTPTPTNPETESGVQSWVLFRALLESTVCCACRG